MNVLFLSLVYKENIEEPGIYTDLLREFRDHGHNVYVVSPYEARYEKETEYVKKNDVHMLFVKIGNITKCGRFEKGFSTLKINNQFLKAIKKHFINISFDIVIYPTPPITLAGVVQYIKKRDNAKTYLLLKDIFPQNAVDIGMMKTSGLQGILYKYFRKKEKHLYCVSDYIGCMSDANIEYVLKNNPEIDENKVGISPNCIEPRNLSLSFEESVKIRKKYGIPKDKMVFVYGGNLGKPQGIHFLIECLRSQKNNNNVFFIIVGDGTEYKHIEYFIHNENPLNVKLMKRLPKEDYDRMVSACDVGMVFLDYRFTIPNFPSRILSYMQAEIPILACTDSNTDIGKVIHKGGFGWWCESNDCTTFSEIINKIDLDDCHKRGKQGYKFLVENYSVEQQYQTIMNQIKE